MSAIGDKIEGKRPLVIIGTSGSTDYLNDTTGDRRYWPVSSSPVDTPPPSAEDRAVVQRLVEATGGQWLVEAGESCDGLHDEAAPTHYLCSRCFPDLRGDLTAPRDDEYDEARQDEAEEME